jgi:hypothetical protein
MAFSGNSLHGNSLHHVAIGGHVTCLFINPL